MNFFWTNQKPNCILVTVVKKYLLWKQEVLTKTNY